MAALLGVPLEGRAVVTQIVREGCHVIGSVREAQDVIADQIAGGRVAEASEILTVCDHRELFYNEPIQVLSLNFLSGDEIECN